LVDDGQWLVPVKLCTFLAPAPVSAPAPSAAPSAPLPGIVRGETVTRLEAPDLIGYLADGRSAGEAESYALADVRLLAPILTPPSIRDFFAFEQHVATARANRGQPVPEYWYVEPVFYFTNPAAVVGPEETIAFPWGTDMLDFELEVAAVIGAGEQIAGFTIMNDWSARDVQRAETSVGLGPAKGKDFATSLGPLLITIDEFDGTSATMLARVNGVEQSRGELSRLHYPWEVIRVRAALNTRLRPGDVLGSGTVGTGCLLEQLAPAWLQPGDLVELEVEGLGILRNRIGPRPADPHMAS
jgi:fumarylacetoacetate (FAA) hydrolase